MSSKTLPSIMVAPNGARRTKADHASLPVRIEETVATAKACFEAGAGALHAHVRDDDGAHILDAGQYRELIAEMAAQVPEMGVQITTEAVGRYTATEQRKLVRDVMPSMVSVGLVEMLSDGDEQAAREFYYFAHEADIAVQHIVYDAGQLSQLLECQHRSVIPSGRLQLMLVLGRYTTGQQSDESMLTPYLDVLSKSDVEHDWAVCAFGMAETACLRAAYSNGGKARVGFENSLHNADGTIARDNAERVAEIAAVRAQTQGTISFS